MIRLGTLLLGFLLVLGGSVGVRADDAALCDLLASDDAGRAAMVPLTSIDANQAVPACAAAVAEQPASSALMHQYARALERAGRLDDAQRLYDWAAEDGYAPAVAALARLRSGAATEPAWSDAERESFSTEMAAVAGALRRYADALPTDPSVPLAVLAVTGTDPAAILAWMSAHTRLVPYLGSLRGARGVLADRAGNSLDRALTLAMLLAQAGQEVRLAHSSLDAAQAEALLNTTREIEAAPRLAVPTREELIAQFADPRFPDDQLAAAATQVVDRAARTEKLLAERTDALLPVLLAASQPAAAAADAAARTNALAALAEHFWVQVRSGTGWRDFDPDASRIGAQVPADTLDPTALPDGLRHAVTLRVILELQDTSGRREEQLLSRTVYPADDGVATLTLSHLGKGLDALEQMAGAPDLRQRVLDTIDAVSAWTPVLLAGNQTVVDKLFTRDGDVRPGNINAFAATGGQVGDLFADVGDALAAEAPVAKAPAVPTAEWLEIEVRVPGAEPRIERRTIFDLIGPAARASGALVAITPDLVRLRAMRLVGATDILIAGAVPSEIAVGRARALTVARVADNIRSFAAMPEDAALSDVPTGPRLPLTLLRFAGQRLWAAGAPALVSPNVFLMHDRFGWDAAAGASRQTEFDIVFNDVADTPFAGQVRQGVIDTILENALVGDPQSGNAAALHAVDLSTGRPWQRLAAGDAVQLAALSPDTRARVEADLGAGYIVVAPGSPTPAGDGEAWWRIDPRTGATLGMMSSGGGAELAEYGLLLEYSSSVVCFVGVGMAVRGIVDGSTGNVRKSVGLCLMAAGGGVVGSGVGVVAGGASVVAVLLAYGIDAVTN